MKRIITLLLTLAMTFSLAMPAQAASTKASTMRLMDTVGTATVENAAGKNLSIKDNMRLYNGYEVATKDASYAYISLDSSKAVKLDASSAVKVNQSGKKLELDVTAGELMFNVPVALKSDESLNIRTSTMVTGIRGTAGWVNALDRYTTRVAVLEGAVTINSQDPFTGADRAVTITGGQIATIIRHERANAIQQQLMDDGVIIEENIIAELTKPGQIVEEIQEADIPGFVAQEVSFNSDLQDRISEESPLNVDEIIKDAQQRLNEEEKVAEKQNKIIEEKLKLLSATNPGLPFTTPEVIVQTNTVVDRVEVPGQNVPIGLNNPDAGQVNTALAVEGTTVLAITNPSYLDLKEIKLGSSQTLYVIGGTLINNEETTLAGTLHLYAGANLTNTGTLHIPRLLEVGSGSTFTNDNGAVINITGVLDVAHGSDFINRGPINISSSIFTGLSVGGTFTNQYGGNICVGAADSDGAVTPGMLHVEKSGTFINRSGTVTLINDYMNHSTFENDGYVELQSGTVKATGDGSSIYCIENSGTLLANGGSIVAEGTYGTDVTCILTKSSDSSITVKNSGSLIAFTDTGDACGIDMTEGGSVFVAKGLIEASVTSGSAYGISTWVTEAAEIEVVSGGTITAYAEGDSAYGIYLNRGNHIATINGGTITASTTESIGSAYGIYINTGSKAIVNGGTISAASSEVYDDSYGIYNYCGSLSISGGTISGKTGVYNGGGSTIISAPTSGEEAPAKITGSQYGYGIRSTGYPTSDGGTINAYLTINSGIISNLAEDGVALCEGEYNHLNLSNSSGILKAKHLTNFISHDEEYADGITLSTTSPTYIDMWKFPCAYEEFVYDDDGNKISCTYVIHLSEVEPYHPQ